MASSIRSLIGSKRNGLGDAQGRSTTPNLSSTRRAAAKARRITQKDLNALNPKQEPSSQKPALNNHTGYETIPQDNRQFEDEEHREGIFDTASVAPEDFDQTKSSIDFNEGYEQHNGDDVDPAAVRGYPNGNYNTAPQEYRHPDRRYQPELVEQGLGGYDEDDGSSSSDVLEEGDEGDDRTLNAHEMPGAIQRVTFNENPEAMNLLQNMHHDPKYAAFMANKSTFPYRQNGRIPVAVQPTSKNEPAPFQHKTSNKAQDSAYKLPLSPLPSADRKYQREPNRQYSPAGRYEQRRSNSLSPVGQGNEWGGHPDGLSSEDQIVKDRFAPSVDGQDALLPTHSQGKRQYAGSEHSSEMPEVNTEPIQPDYDEDVLYGMNYATLKEQAFDAKPGEHVPNKSNSVPPPEASLDDRLAMVSKESRERQEEYLSHMSKEEWEKSGDWFIDQFTDLMKKMREARQTKRDIAKRFEDEISAREEAVRGKTLGLERVMREMKTGGEGVLRRKI